jgi:hypothetical protein
MQKKSLVTILRPVDICHQLNSSMQAGQQAAGLQSLKKSTCFEQLSTMG